MSLLQEAGRFIREQIDLHHPNSTIRQEAALRKSLRVKLNSLLGGKPQVSFHLDQPIYSGLVWHAPTAVAVLKISNGAELFVQTDDEAPYGEQVILSGRTVELYERFDTGREPIQWTFSRRATPLAKWEAAHAIVNRVIMATSGDSQVQQEYQQLRNREQKDHEKNAEAWASTWP